MYFVWELVPCWLVNVVVPNFLIIIQLLTSSKGSSNILIVPPKGT